MYGTWEQVQDAKNRISNILSAVKSANKIGEEGIIDGVCTQLRPWLCMYYGWAADGLLPANL